MAENSERPAQWVTTNQTHNGSRGGKAKSKYRSQKARDPSQGHGKNKNRQPVTFSTSGIHNNDVGIFVTSDKGQEKKCLRELVDLLSEFIEQDNQAPAEGANDYQKESADDEFDIEADIQAELDSLKTQQHPVNGQTQKLSLVELDIPCVSFVRLPTSSVSSQPLDPVEIVRKLCTSASEKDNQGPRSRYIKRLTPVSLIRKTMNDGLEILCDEILPPHFSMNNGPSAEDSSKSNGRHLNESYKFAIRPTIRNNNKIDRDRVIRVVADKVTSLGKGKHTVDLKGYDKLILVDVYRNVVGMSVVGNEFETLKRFNLSEIHSSHFDEKTLSREDKIN